MSENHGKLPKRLRNPVKKQMNEDNRYHLRVVPSKRVRRTEKIKPTNYEKFIEDDA